MAERGAGAKKLKEKLERKKRYQLEKDYNNAIKRGPTRDPTMARKQHAFCTKLVEDFLDDAHALSFSKPVTDLWDREDLPGYFEKVKRPMDLGTVQKSLAKGVFANKDTDLFDFRLFAADMRLVFSNCMSYNSPGTELAKLAKRFLTTFDKSVREIPLHKPDKDTVVVKSDPDTPEKPRKPDHRSDSDDGASSPDEGPARRAGGGDPERKARKASAFDARALSDASASADDESGSDLDEGRSDAKQRRGGGGGGGGSGGSGGAAAGDGGSSGAELESLKRKAGALEKLKARAEGAIAELDMERNVPMTADERVMLRDEVEQAPWEKVDKVVHILKKYVDSAVSELGKGADPEYVTLELNDVEPHLLRDVEAVVRPCPRREIEAKKIEKIESDLRDVHRSIKDLKRAASGNAASRKKQKRRR